MKIIVVGAGASGLYSSILIKQFHPEYDVVVFDKNKKIGKKMFASGNGRCNVGNSIINKNSYNCKFAYDLVNQFQSFWFTDFYTKKGICLTLDGNLYYPNSFSSDTVVNSLVDSAKKSGVKFNLEEEITEYTSSEIKTNKGNYKFDKLIFACGSASGKNFGTDGSIYNLLKSHGYKINDLRSGLCPIQTKENLNELQGIRTKANVIVNNGNDIYSENGEVLFKNNGLSGIVIFNVASIIVRNKIENCKIKLDLFPEFDEKQLYNLFNSLNRSGNNFVSGTFQINLGKYILSKAAVRFKDTYTPEEIKKIVNISKCLTFNYFKNYDFESGQVTVGGISIDCIDKSTFESMHEKGVYFIGECLDVDGLCGGYNLMWALASSYALARGIK